MYMYIYVQDGIGYSCILATSVCYVNGGVIVYIYVQEGIGY